MTEKSPIAETAKAAGPMDAASYGEYRYATWSPRFMAACSVICLAIVAHLTKFLMPAFRGAIPAGSSLTEVILVAAYCLLLLAASVYMAMKAASRLRFSLTLGRDGFALSGRRVPWSDVTAVHFQVVRIMGRGQERLKVSYRDPASGRPRSFTMDWVLTGWNEIKDIFQRENRAAS